MTPATTARPLAATHWPARWRGNRCASSRTKTSASARPNWAIRGKGLFVGIVLKREAGGARRFCEALQERGVLAKETHEHIIRLAPPLVITREQIDWAVEQVAEVLTMA